jgi:hypothetical protein
VFGSMKERENERENVKSVRYDNEFELKRKKRIEVLSLSLTHHHHPPPQCSYHTQHTHNTRTVRVRSGPNVRAMASHTYAACIRTFKSSDRI